MKDKAKFIIINIFAGLIMFFLLCFPKSMIEAAKDGLLAWFNSVVPSLFPFMVTANILTANSSSIKIPAFISCPFERFFNVSKNGITAYIFGMLSGYPLGAKISADLYFKNHITKTDVQKLLSFCCNAGPMFIVGTLSCEILNFPQAGYIILLSSFISNTVSGLFLNLFLLSPPYNSKSSILSCSSRNSGSSAVQGSCEAIIRVGGYIILFSVISKILEITGITDMISNIVSSFSHLGFPETKAIVTGIMEMTCGINMLKQSYAPVAAKAAIGAFLVSFGGISVIAQSADFLRGTGAKIWLFAFCKLINGIITSIITYFCILIL